MTGILLWSYCRKCTYYHFILPTADSRNECDTVNSDRTVMVLLSFKLILESFSIHTRHVQTGTTLRNHS